MEDNQLLNTQSSVLLTPDILSAMNIVEQVELLRNSLTYSDIKITGNCKQETVNPYINSRTQNNYAKTSLRRLAYS